MTISKRVLQVGWRRRGSAALRQLGFEVDVIVDAESWDWYSHPGWTDAADDVLFVENSNWSEHLAFLLGRIRHAGRAYDAVVGFDEFALMPTWQVATMLGLPGLDWQVVCAMRDKSAQKGIVRAGGVPCARTWLFDDVRRQRDEILGLHERLPLVIKPYSGAATVNTFAAHTHGELASTVERIASTSSRTVLVETYVSGVEHHADGVVSGGVVRTFSLNRYLGNVITIASGAVLASVTVPPAEQPGLCGSARDLVSRALGLLGLRDGVFHVELFLTSGGWVFSEAAMRVGGAGVPLQHEAVAGIDLHLAMARAQLGRAWPATRGLNEAGPEVTGWTYLPGPPGTIRAYPPRDEILKLDGVIDVEFDLIPGQQLSPSTADSVARVGSAVLAAPSEAEFLRRQSHLVTWFRDRVMCDV